MTNLYSKILNKSHQQIDLILPEKPSRDGCNPHFRIDPIPGSVFPLQTPIVAT